MTRVQNIRCGLLAALGAAIAMLSVACLCTGVSLADDYNGRDDWQITFTAQNQMERNYGESAFKDAVSDMQPGDTHEIRIATVNQNPATTSWYIANEVIQSLEHSTEVAKGGAYTYYLSYAGPGGEQKVLYDSENVGGDEVGEEGPGLSPVTSALKDYTFLGKLAPQERGQVTLRVHLDGETENNAYQNTLANIHMNFAVEADPATAQAPGSNSTQSNPVFGSVPRTGDFLSMLPYIVVAVLGIALFILAILGRRWHKEEKREALR